jgi:hypothetical protein
MIDVNDLSFNLLPLGPGKPLKPRGPAIPGGPGVPFPPPGGLNNQVLDQQQFKSA